MVVVKGSKLSWDPSILTKRDHDDKIRLEGVVISFLGEKKIEAGTAIMEIIHRNLYLEEYRSATQYMYEKFGLRMDAVRRLMSFVPADVHARLTKIGVNVELEPLPPRHRPKVYDNGSTKQSTDYTNLTPHGIRRAKEEVLPAPESHDGLEPIDGEVVQTPAELAAKRAADWNQRIDAFVSALRSAREMFKNEVMAHCPPQTNLRLIDARRVGDSLKSIADHVKASKAEATCGYCLGSGRAVGFDEADCPCAPCDGRGWTTAMAEAQASDDQKGAALA